VRCGDEAFGAPAGRPGQGPRRDGRAGTSRKADPLWWARGLVECRHATFALGYGLSKKESACGVRTGVLSFSSAADAPKDAQRSLCDQAPTSAPQSRNSKLAGVLRSTPWLNVTHEFVDEAISGTVSIMSRPGLGWQIWIHLQICDGSVSTPGERRPKNAIVTVDFYRSVRSNYRVNGEDGAKA
jgi:hypothetical protein